MRSTLPLAFDPALVEEVVLRCIAGHAAEREFRRKRNSLYVLPADDARERAFHEYHDQWFRTLDLAGPIAVAIDEVPSVSESCARALVRRATSRHDEGADLLVASEPEGADVRTLLLRLSPEIFARPEALLALLRAELLHVADMLDPDFGYEPALPVGDGGPSYEHLLRDRYCVLWHTTVVGRLTRRGLAPPESEARVYREFCAAFPMLGDSAEVAFRRFFAADEHTHAELIAFASVPRDQHAHPGLLAGGRCPLCRFSTYAPEPASEMLPASALTAILADFPAWRPADGLCSQCAELYRASAMSAAAAAQLPGAPQEADGSRASAATASSE